MNAGLPPPQLAGQEINGTNLEPVFDDPTDVAIKDAAYSQFGKDSTFSVDTQFFRNQTIIMGYTVRVRDWRYTSWFAFDQTLLVPIRDKVLGRELYDHRGDTGLWLDYPGENKNLVD